MMEAWLHRFQPHLINKGEVPPGMPPAGKRSWQELAWNAMPPLPEMSHWHITVPSCSATHATL
jgi:hypothetical protein